LAHRVEIVLGHAATEIDFRADGLEFEETQNGCLLEIANWPNCE